MSVETLYILRKDEPRSSLKDLDVVVLTADVSTDDGDTMHAGSQGTIVGVWRDGAAYEVEFPEPPGALATVPADALKRVE